MVYEYFAMLFGTFLIVYSSPKVVNYSSALAKISKISPLLIGILVIGIGTSVPEISNSIISSLLGHGDINVGDTIGSSISQITLVLGLVMLIGGLKTDRDDMIVLGSSALLAVIISLSIVFKGYITNLDGLLLILFYFVLVFILRNYIKKGYFPIETEERVYKARKLNYIALLLLSTAGVVFGSYVLVTSVITISQGLGVPEFVTSFLFVGISTSLPELSIGISAARKKEYSLILGDLFGSNIVDVTLSLGFGPLIAANILSNGSINFTGFYLLFATVAATFIIAWKKKLDKKYGVLFILLYLISLPLILL